MKIDSNFGRQILPISDLLKLKILDWEIHFGVGFNSVDNIIRVGGERHRKLESTNSTSFSAIEHSQKLSATKNDKEIALSVSR